jgi:hypothetical protein
MTLSMTSYLRHLLLNAYILHLLLLSGFSLLPAACGFRPIHSLSTQPLYNPTQPLPPFTTSLTTVPQEQDSASERGSSREAALTHKHQHSLLLIRGGEALVRAAGRGLQTPPPASVWSRARSSFLDIPPASRMHVSLVLLTTAVQMLGLPAYSLFSLPPLPLSAQRLLLLPLQFWRPFTACAYLGPPSMALANNLYFLLKFGRALEGSTGSATHAWFLLTQTLVLSTSGTILLHIVQLSVNSSLLR